MKIVTASCLPVRKRPSNESKVTVKKGTIVEISGPPVTYNKKKWIPIMTVNEPVISGYVLLDFLKNV